MREMKFIDKHINKMSDENIVKILLQEKINKLKNENIKNRLNEIVNKYDKTFIDTLREFIGEKQEKVISLYETRNDNDTMSKIDDLKPLEDRDMFYYEAGQLNALESILNRIFNK